MARSATLLTFLLLLTAALLLAGADAAPWFDLFGLGNPQRGQRGQRRPSAPGGSRSGRDRFKSICRTINPDNYAFPGRAPYPSAPLCPY